MNRQARGKKLEEERNAQLIAMFGPTAIEDIKPPPLYARTHKRAAAGRNDPCPCGSGRKYKKCCLNKET